MEIKFFGANCLKMFTKKSSVIVDDNLAELGKKTITTDKDISLSTQTKFSHPNNSGFMVNSPGEYELGEVSIKGMPSKLHYDPEKKSVMYLLHIGGLSVAVLGHISADLSEEQCEAFGVVDVLILPVGGNGYTLDPLEAVKIIKLIEPKIVIPTHYAIDGFKYEVEQQRLEDFIKKSEINDIETLDSLKIKDSNLPEKTRIVILKAQ